MNNGLLIVGAGVYGLVAKEIAVSTGEFNNIAFMDDFAKEAPDGTAVLATFSDLQKFSKEYSRIIVAIGNPNVREELIERIKTETEIEIVSLISPFAFVSPSAELGEGCIVEPMAVIHAGCKLSIGCIVSAGAVVNHAAECGRYVHVDCNATVSGNVVVPDKAKVCSGEVFR